MSQHCIHCCVLILLWVVSISLNPHPVFRNIDIISIFTSDTFSICKWYFVSEEAPAVVVGACCSWCSVAFLSRWLQLLCCFRFHAAIINADRSQNLIKCFLHDCSLLNKGYRGSLYLLRDEFWNNTKREKIRDQSYQVSVINDWLFSRSFWTNPHVCSLVPNIFKVSFFIFKVC